MLTSIHLTLPVLCIPESCTEIKIKLNFYFHTSLWCLKMFYEGLKGLSVGFFKGHSWSMAITPEKLASIFPKKID